MNTIFLFFFFLAKNEGEFLHITKGGSIMEQEPNMREEKRRKKNLSEYIEDGPPIQNYSCFIDFFFFSLLFSFSFFFSCPLVDHYTRLDEKRLSLHMCLSALLFFFFS
ncbi:hypothetical protein F5X96DRAFT_638055 [Biscogniauxia mediterranea]|nr:hypothetical protein F5X96DRAFT_638055 [Biscogniauxia mediterranea]